ncbi:predicted protein [Lichtheimia corymbifera JMRC:FSU:9682]|uniref:Uncharacterized protein n=1 Tax=Lichtheimia corymbifera JMRC:FSU:9682 TaxID=1263082 RepID=A0A068RYN0_9FUNG|nr:predicted protein [Lichtheimia corymbifera JMRC:FSU:9682]
MSTTISRSREISQHLIVVATEPIECAYVEVYRKNPRSGLHSSAYYVLLKERRIWHACRWNRSSAMQPLTCMPRYLFQPCSLVTTVPLCNPVCYSDILVILATFLNTILSRL